MTALTFASDLLVDTMQSGKLHKFEVVPTVDEIAQLIERFGFIAVEDCRAEVDIRKVARDCWDVKGRLTAAVTQACVVTGAPLLETVDFVIEERYVREQEDSETVEVSLDGVEPLKNGAIDIGELVTQSLALAVTAWPRSDEASESYELGEVADDHPFASLSVLKKK